MSESVFTVHTFPIVLPTSASKWHLVPIGDQHQKTEAHDADRYKAWLQECRRLQNAYFIFLGDELEFASSSERAALRVAKLHGSTIRDLDLSVLAKCKEFVAQHDWMRGRIVGMIQGNHTWAWMTSDSQRGIREGETSTQWIANALGCAWLGWLSYARVNVRGAGRGASRYNVDICAAHGKAGGKLVGTPINQVADLRGIFPSCEIYIMGHDHKRGAWPDSSLYLPTGGGRTCEKIKQRRQWFIRSGSWLKAYEPGVGGYVVGRLLRPAELGGVVVDIQAHKRTAAGDRSFEADIHVRA